MDGREAQRRQEVQHAGGEQGDLEMPDGGRRDEREKTLDNTEDFALSREREKRWGAACLVIDSFP